MKKSLTKISLLLYIIFALSGCISSYKSTWDCPKVKGIGCSSVEYADFIARKQIVANTKAVAPASNCDICQEEEGDNK